jgi:hypothetical protein
LAIEPAAERIADRVLSYMHACGPTGATAEEIEIATGIAGNTVRPRLLLMKKAGLVVPTTSTRPTRAGRQAAVWIATATT